MQKWLFAACVGVCLTSVGLLADNWPHWRGPSHDGVSRETGLPVKWSATENVSWKLDLPAYSGATPIIWGNHIFLNVATANNTGEIELWAVDRTKGAVLWKRPIAGGNHIERKQNMSSPSPVTDGKMVWVMTGVGMLKAFDFAGKELWARDIQTDYGRFGLNWGYASSPLLHGDALYVQVLHGMKTDDPSYVLKIDKLSGQDAVEGRSSDRRAAASRPIPTRRLSLVQTKDRTEIVISGGDAVTAHDPATGKELWRVSGLNPQNRGDYRIVASPLMVARLDRVAEPQQPAHRDPSRRQRQRHGITRRLVVRAWPGCADAGQRWHVPVRGRRERRRVLPGRRRRARSSTARSGCRTTSTARLPFWQTARST